MTRHSAEDPAPVIELAPQGTPPAIGVLRRIASGLLGLLLGFAALFALTTPTFHGLIFIMGLMLLGGAAVLVGTALFPSLTFQKLDRSRWR